MKENSDILSKVPHRDGMTVPDGYFADFTGKMAAMLPEKESAVQPAPGPRRRIWNAVRPYVYMAAMFAGVWCMLKMFTIMSGHNDLRPMDSNPIMAEAFSNDEFFFDYVSDDISQWDVLDEMVEDGSLDEGQSLSVLFEEEAPAADADSNTFILPDHEQI